MINDALGCEGVQSNCTFIPYLYGGGASGASGGSGAPRLVVALITTVDVPRGGQLLTGYGRQYWEAKREALDDRKRILDRFVRPPF